MDEQQAIWDARYEKVLRGRRGLEGEPWLEEWLHLVPGKAHRRALDVGCGAGHNAKLLLEHGFEVTAIDFSEQALELCRREAPQARLERVDLRKGLPFEGESLELIVADLSLHYFKWDLTVALVRDIANSLVPEGVFAGRFNSTNDINYGAGAGTPVDGDANLLAVGGIEKRFFTRECLDELFGSPWTIVALEEKATSRFGSQKVLWEVVATRSAVSPDT